MHMNDAQIVYSRTRRPKIVTSREIDEIFDIERRKYFSLDQPMLATSG